MSGLSAFGTELRMGKGDTTPGPETFELIGGVTNISGPGFALDVIDVTAHDSPGAFEEAIGTIIRQGDITLDINYDPNDPTHGSDPTPGAGVGIGLAAALFARATKNFELEFPSTPAVIWTLQGLVTGFEPSAPYDDKLSASVTIKITGQPSLGAP